LAKRNTQLIWVRYLKKQRAGAKIVFSFEITKQKKS